MTLSKAPVMSRKTAIVEVLFKNPCCMRLVRVTKLFAQERELGTKIGLKFREKKLRFYNQESLR